MSAQQPQGEVGTHPEEDTHFLPGEGSEFSSFESGGLSALGEAGALLQPRRMVGTLGIQDFCELASTQIPNGLSRSYYFPARALILPSAFSLD